MLDKLLVYDAVSSELDSRTEILQNSLNDLSSILEEQIKSSAGDKHETSRATTHREQEKLSGQLNRLIKLKNALSRIDPLDKHDSIQYGSLVKTNQGYFFFSIGIGAISVANNKVFCITSTTPLGQVLLDKSKGDTLKFRNESIEIFNVS